MHEFPESKLLASACLFEKQHGVVGPYEEGEIAAAGLINDNAAEIAAQICATLDSEIQLSPSYRTTAHFALGKRFDPVLMGFFRKHLAVEVERNMEVAYQIMIALNNLDESVWPKHLHSFSSMEHDANREAAREYLRSIQD